MHERGQPLEFSFDDRLRYAGPHSPAGVATAFRAMQRGFAVLSPDRPVQRRSVVVRTAFQGPGARDGFEAVTRAVTDGRTPSILSLARPDRGRLLQSFVFEIGIGDRSATLLLRDGVVTDAFIDLAGKIRPQRHRGKPSRRVEGRPGPAVAGVSADRVYDVA